MKKHNLAVMFLSIALSFPLGIKAQEEVTDVMEQQPQAVNEIIDTNVQEENLSSEELIPQKPEESLTTNSFKQPVSKKKIIKKFLLAMFGVGISSAIIYFGLTLYNKIRYGYVNSKTESFSDNESSLNTPETLSEAVKTFIDKTKWD